MNKKKKNEKKQNRKFMKIMNAAPIHVNVRMMLIIHIMSIDITQLSDANDQN